MNNVSLGSIYIYNILFYVNFCEKLLIGDSYTPKLLTIRN